MVLEGVHGPGPDPRPVADQIRGPGRKMRDNFPTGPSREKKNKSSNGPCRADKKEKRRIILRVSPARQNKHEVFKPVIYQNSNIPDWGTTNVNVPMKCVFQSSLDYYKQKSNDFLYYY